MAEKRMFSKKITESDAFLDMPASTQNLYFHLSMNADDEGFVDKAKSIMRMIGAREDDMKVLISKAFIIPFESGVIVIKHWRMNNYLRSDRFTPTAYVEEKKQIETKENGSYTLKNSIGIPMVDQTDTQYRIDKNRLDKNSIDIVDACLDKNGPGAYEIINYLNEKTGKKYKHIESNTKFIKARLKDGYSIEDLKKVIDLKVKEWKGTNMDKYLRCETLFNATKFETYVNEAPEKLTSTKSPKLNGILEL